MVYLLIVFFGLVIFACGCLTTWVALSYVDIEYENRWRIDPDAAIARIEDLGNQIEALRQDFSRWLLEDDDDYDEEDDYIYDEDEIDEDGIDAVLSQGKGVCPHGEEAGDCNACMVASDFAFDAWRESR